MKKVTTTKTCALDSCGATFTIQAGTSGRPKKFCTKSCRDKATRYRQRDAYRLLRSLPVS